MQRGQRLLARAAAPRHAWRSLRTDAAGEVWARRTSERGVYRLGATAALRDSLGEIGFADLPAALGDVLLPGRPFAMLEGPAGQAILASPLQGEISGLNLAHCERPAALSADPEAEAAWLVELDAFLEDDDDESEFEAIGERAEVPKDYSNM